MIRRDAIELLVKKKVFKYVFVLIMRDSYNEGDKLYKFPWDNVFFHKERYQLLCDSGKTYVTCLSLLRPMIWTQSLNPISL
mgnify:CR=1 FL=1